MEGAAPKAVGIPAVQAEVRTAEDVSYLLVERYDRTKLKKSRVKRVHQEDFCQALGISSLNKHQADGGPTFKMCFDLLDRTTFPAISRKQFIDLVIFNYLIGNADAHAKNFSLLHQEDGVIKLAPAHDLLCTRIYKQTTFRMSMSIGKERDFESVKKNNWEFSSTIESI